MKTGVEAIGRTVSVKNAKRGCLDKQRYGSKTRARDVAAKLLRTKPDWPPLRPYRCGICAGWHLTSSQPHGLTSRKAA